MADQFESPWSARLATSGWIIGHDREIKRGGTRGEDVVRWRRLDDMLANGQFTEEQATLMAAAPDLYSALLALYDRDTAVNREKARAALTKARGEAS